LDLNKLYEDSTFDYSTESLNLGKTYIRLLKRISKRLSYNSVLEIGGGNGFFLDAALDSGIKEIRGIEPSREAIDSSSVRVKPHMIQSMLTRDVVKDLSYDVVTIFHVLDHLPDPLDSLRMCKDAMTPGGAILIAVHNCESISARLLKSRSPIFDVEHTYLYSKKTLKNLLLKAGYENVEVKSYWNSYSFAYLIHLLPISRSLRISIKRSRINLLLSKLKVRVPLGNMYAIASKNVGETNS
jgi:SAM-dependent methyltransferase